jgi:hypothetical protein
VFPLSLCVTRELVEIVHAEVLCYRSHVTEEDFLKNSSTVLVVFVSEIVFLGHGTGNVRRWNIGLMTSSCALFVT